MAELQDYLLKDLLDMDKYVSKMCRGGLSDFAPAIITCAITGMQQSKAKNPYLPVTFEEQVEACEGAYNAGAAMCHIHVRDQKNLDQMTSNPEDYYTVNKLVRAKCPDLIINNTCGAGRLRVDNGPLLEKNIVSMNAKAEVATIDVEGLPFGKAGGVNGCYSVTPGEVDECVDGLLANGTVPEWECFDIGDIRYVEEVIKSRKLGSGPVIMDLIINPVANYQTIDYMIEATKFMPKNSVVSILPTGAAQFPLLAAALILGFNVRVGMEDNIYLNRGEKAKTNAELVEKAVAICKILGRKIATPAEARAMMGLGAPRQYED